MTSVLVIEDDDDLREAMADVLSNDGHRVLEARNGREAIDLLRGLEVMPHVIILDLMMPVMNGVEFCAEQRCDPQLRGIPIMLVSASSQLPTSAADLGVAGFARKPLALSTLLSIAERYSSSGRTTEHAPSSENVDLTAHASASSTAPVADGSGKSATSRKGGDA
jgi:CheY-like chemotaxis protein